MTKSNNRSNLRAILQNEDAPFETHDVTGFKRIGRGRNDNDYSNDVCNLQRRVNVELFRLNKANGFSSQAAAKDTGYSEATLRNLRRVVPQCSGAFDTSNGSCQEELSEWNTPAKAGVVSFLRDTFVPKLS